MYEIRRKIKVKEDIKIHLKPILKNLKDTIEDLNIKKSKPLVYWLNDWNNKFLSKEDDFKPETLIRYERGMIIQAHLGYKVGSEQGGLRYCLVIENDNDLTNKVIMVIPLRSLKPKEKVEEIDERFEKFLGYGIFKNDIKKLETKIKKLNKLLAKTTDEEATLIKNDIEKADKKLKSLKLGTVAMVSQMCCLSKMRIFYPTYNGDELYTFRLGKRLLRDIDKVIMKQYLTPKIRRKVKSSIVK